MANFPGLILTDAGRSILSRALAGQPLTFTTVALGDGAAPANPEALVALVSQKQSLSIQDFEILGDGSSRIRAILTNDGLEAGFFVREIGAYAQDPDTLQDVLYCYGHAGEQSDYLPAAGGATLVEQIFDLITVIDTAENVTAVIDDYITLATKADIEEIRPYLLPVDGVAGQLLRKASNAQGDTEWFDANDGVPIRVASINETRQAVEGQRVFNLTQTTTASLAVYVDGLRLRPDEWVALNLTQVQLDAPLTAGQWVIFVQNEEVGSGGGGGGTAVIATLISGPTTVFPGSTNTYTITNFDAFAAYSVATDVGTATISGDLITLAISEAETATALSLSVTRNGATDVFQIAVGSSSVAAPAVLSPAQGATGLGSGPLLTTSAFLTYPSNSDTHASTDWQVATDAGFTAVVWSSMADAANLEAVTVPGGTLSAATTYYVRARHNGTTLGASPWSATVSFATADAFFPQVEVAKLLASDGAASDLFGISVAISGDYAIVGAYGDDDNGSSSGSAYVFERIAGTWTQVAKLDASDGAASDRFGISVAISGDYAIVGADRDDDNGSNSGSAYVFERIAGTWTQVAKLDASDGAASDSFGISVAISGDYAIVGAHQDDDNGSNSGSAYVFERISGTWTQVAKLIASDGAANDIFGYSVAISGDYAIVGASGDADNGSASGSAYVFERIAGTWTQVAKLDASDGAASDIFGTSVSISGDYAIVGAYGRDTSGSPGGSAYVFERIAGTWTQVAILTASDGYQGDEFGISVAISGDCAIVGADRDDDSGAESGSAYVFERIAGTWTQVAKLTASDGASLDLFGISVAISGSYAIVGAHYDDDNGADSGSAYIFE